MSIAESGIDGYNYLMVIIVAVAPCVVFLLFRIVAFGKILVVAMGVMFPLTVFNDFIVIPCVVIAMIRVIGLSGSYTSSYKDR